MQLFDVLNSQLFKPLTGRYRGMFAEMLMLIWNHCRTSTDYGMGKSEMIRLAEDYLDGADFEVSELEPGEEAEEQLPSRDLHSRAVWCVARLRNCGWLEDLEIGYEEDARTAICPQVVPILQAFYSIVHPQTVTYSGKLNKAYQLLGSIATESAPYENVLKEVASAMDELNSALRNLNASIGSFIDQMTQHKTPQEVLDLFEKYEEEIVVAAYQRFKTSDNLFNYREALLCLEDLPFIDHSNNAPSSRDNFCISTGRMQPIDKQSEAKNLICQRLGIGKSDSPLGKKFSSVFPMGTSLDEIHDFRTFIYEYILPQPIMDLEALQKDEQELENLQETLTQAQRRAQQLQEIVALGEQAIEKDRDVCVNKGFILFAQYQLDASTQTQLFADRERCIDLLERLEKQYDEAQQQAETAHAAYQQAWKAAQDSDEGKFLEVLRQKARDTARELGELQKKVSKCRNTQIEITELLQKASSIYSVDADMYPDAIRKQPQRNQMPMLESLENEIAKLNAAIDKLHADLLVQSSNLQKTIDDLEARIRRLEKGQFVYPNKDRANVVRNAINKAFAEQGMEPDAKVLCELLYMTDESWQDCVEACMGYRRFDILVSPEHYPAAKHVFECLGEDVGRVSLLDSRALHRDRNKAAVEGNIWMACVYCT